MLRSCISRAVLAVSFCTSANAKAISAQLPYAEPTKIVQINAEFGLTDNADSMLCTNGFVVLDSHSRNALTYAYPGHVFSPYTFVTSSAMLELWAHVTVTILKVHSMAV